MNDCKYDEYEDEDEDVHVISDQDSTDDKPPIENIIVETSKKFKNESTAVKILLTEHYRDFRLEFFEKIKLTDKSIYQGIKKEIRNYLNPYRIFIEKDIEIPKEAKELNELLKGYYKERNFNDTFFLNYFKDLEEAHKKKSKIVKMLPKDEIETLNDIQRKVVIIQNMRHYLNGNICDRMQTNFEQKKELFENDYFLMMYKYLVIDEDELSDMKEEKLFEYLSNKNSSNKLRRPLNDFNFYNYIPILCKGYCQKEANFFIDKFNKSINVHVNENDCERCKKIKENMSKINSQIKSLYLKTCIFSHNINEIMFHPLMFFSFEVYLPFYQKQFNKKFDEKIKDIVQETIIPKRFKNLKRFEIQSIYNPADVGIKKIYNLLTQYAKKRGLYGKCCYLSEYKTEPCLILFKPNNTDYSVHMKKCPYYHNNLEKRRINKTCENEICNCVIEDGKWINKEEKINCRNGDFCNKYHTRNEVFFDEKNYRKLYPCNENNYCEKGDLCPKKHPIDIKIEELYLPIKNKNELEKNLKALIKKDKKIKRRINEIHKAKCRSCLNYIYGAQGRNMYIFNNCNHVICSNCYDHFSSCPLCGFDEINSYDKKNKNENITKIILEGNIINKRKKKDEKKEEQNEEESESSGIEINQKIDDELKYSKNNYIFEEGNLLSDVSIDAKIPLDKNNISKDSENQEKEDEQNKNSHSKKGRKRGKGLLSNNNGDRRNNSIYNNNYENNNEYRENNRGKGRGRGGGRGRRGNNRGKGRDLWEHNNRGKSYYKESNNSYSYVREECEESGYQIGVKGYKKGNKRTGKNRYYNSNRDDDESKLKDSSSKSNDDNQYKDNNYHHYNEQFSMRKENNERKGTSRGGKGRVRGKGFKRGNNTRNNEEKNSSKSDDSNGNELENSM